jgi:ribosomal protein S12 methylthiotransferase
VEGAAANQLAAAVPEQVKEERWHRLMRLQQEISRERTAAKVGRTIDVILDEVGGKGAVGRSKWDAPEIDGLVYLDAGAGYRPGDIIRAKIARAEEYDVWAEPVGRACPSARDRPGDDAARG